jgi:hypothetical protein
VLCLLGKAVLLCEAFPPQIYPQVPVLFPQGLNLLDIVGSLVICNPDASLVSVPCLSEQPLLQTLCWRPGCAWFSIDGCSGNVLGAVVQEDVCVPGAVVQEDVYVPGAVAQEDVYVPGAVVQRFACVSGAVVQRFACVSGEQWPSAQRCDLSVVWSLVQEISPFEICTSKELDASQGDDGTMRTTPNCPPDLPESG